MSLAFLQTSASRFLIKTDFFFFLLFQRKSAAFSFLFDMRVAFSRRRNAAACGGVSLASSYSRNKGYAHRKIMQMNANRWQQGKGRWREAGVCISRRMPRALYTSRAGQSAFKLKAARWKYIGWESDSCAYLTARFSRIFPPRE